MITALTLRCELGENLDLLAKPDQWLENHGIDLANKLSIMIEELESVQKAQKYKRQLQQQNEVAVLHGAGQSRFSVEIMPLPDAIQLLKQHESDSKFLDQMRIWGHDGYDLSGSAQLRERND